MTAAFLLLLLCVLCALATGIGAGYVVEALRSHRRN